MESRMWIIIILSFIFGTMVGGMLIYKVEINTINQAMDSMSYCYDKYFDVKEVFKEDLSANLVCIEGSCYMNNSIWIEGKGFCYYESTGGIICPQ